MIADAVFRKIFSNDTVHEYVSKAYHKKYNNSREYWERRYERDGTSGAGSYGELAQFKADTLESIIDDRGIDSVIEFGCGDGNQLEITTLPQYIGLDVSPTAIEHCMERFREDNSKSFFLYDSGAFHDNHDVFTAELALSSDVIFHLTEDEVYQQYMRHLFGSAQDCVVIYSSNSPDWEDPADHVQHRKFSDWPEENTESWELVETTENEYPWDPSHPTETSRSDFYIFEEETTR